MQNSKAEHLTPKPASGYDPESETPTSHPRNIPL